MIKALYAATLLCVIGTSSLARSQSLGEKSVGEISLRLTPPTAAKGHDATPAVIWLQPVGTVLPFVPQGRYTLLQKNRTFYPHLQVVAVGSTVQFPNVDPFFHNVFSLFDGRRFDLGLYEAGSSKSVGFNREGVSYIFCNIHPEMSAVIVALSTPLYTITRLGHDARIGDIPSGEYELHFWIEGVPQTDLDGMKRPLTVKAGHASLGAVVVPAPERPAQHTSKFGGAYHEGSEKPY
ncbi:hypothetical protein [Granulicella sibirica]|uniref:Copper binding protein, plastocyanin/azurin family n=1 Tax=Granulicella sibirica TaxID=2479048 RepID=A0A4Q0SU19_9BACT|nr:hypothetical protein [Granulicella sibirica]RXH54187.1 Copper binding protein, plastocyanin/azurin family [Granulicella sibirica]